MGKLELTTSEYSLQWKSGGKLHLHQRPLELIDFGKLYLIPAYLRLNLMRLDSDPKRSSKQIPLQCRNIFILSVRQPAINSLVPINDAPIKL